MLELLRIATICLGLVCLASGCLALICGRIALDEKKSSESRDGWIDAMLRSALAAYCTFLATMVFGMLFCILDLFTTVGWWPIV